MHSTGSFLKTILERIRTNLNEPDVDAKYSDDYICRHIIGPAMVDVISRLNLTSGAVPILEFDITLTEDIDTYYLPPCVQQVIRVITTDADGNPLMDAVPRDPMHRFGAGWQLSGSPGCLAFKTPSPPISSQAITVWYTTNGDFQPHYGTAGTLSLATTTPTVVLGLLPTVGGIDRRRNSYIGQVLRILPASPAPREERRIISHNYSGGVWTVVLDSPLEYTSNGTIIYEIAPPGMQSLYEAISVWGSMKLGVPTRISKVHMEELRTQYRAALKTAGDNLTDIQGRLPKHYEKDTIDNRDAQNNWMTLR